MNLRTISVDRRLLAELRLAAEHVNPEVVRKSQILRPAVEVFQETGITFLDRIILKAI
jgi:hypothetical protein